jgi:L-rhamnose mutarotase
VTKVCFVLWVIPERLEEYRARHTPVPEDMLAEIERSGRTNYSLFLSESGLLVGYYETEDDAASREYLAQSQVATKWEEEVRDYFADMPGRADQDAAILTQIFDLKNQLSVWSARNSHCIASAYSERATGAEQSEPPY